MQEQIAVCVSYFPCFTVNGENFAKIGERSAVIAALRAKNNEKNCNRKITVISKISQKNDSHTVVKLPPSSFNEGSKCQYLDWTTLLGAIQSQSLDMLITFEFKLGSHINSRCDQ